ncbi:unnamed protein product [Amoebophrya sp. A25]|nr:unnamed protein product [Amoebophrya sp. A25]|eukprot:GSA25T00025924001.1
MQQLFQMQNLNSLRHRLFDLLGQNPYAGLCVPENVDPCTFYFAEDNVENFVTSLEQVPLGSGSKRALIFKSSTSISADEQASQLGDAVDMEYNVYDDAVNITTRAKEDGLIEDGEEDGVAEEASHIEEDGDAREDSDLDRRGSTTSTTRGTKPLQASIPKNVDRRRGPPSQAGRGLRRDCASSDDEDELPIAAISSDSSSTGSDEEDNKPHIDASDIASGRFSDSEQDSGSRQGSSLADADIVERASFIDFDDNDRRDEQGSNWVSDDESDRNTTDVEDPANHVPANAAENDTQELPVRTADSDCEYHLPFEEELSSDFEQASYWTSSTDWSDTESEDDEASQAQLRGRGHTTSRRRSFSSGSLIDSQQSEIDDSDCSPRQDESL